MANNTVACPITFDSARGGQISKQYSSCDLPSHNKLKYREQTEYGTTEAELHDRKELEERERGVRKKVRAHRRLVIEPSRQAAAPESVLKRPKVVRENDDDDVAALMDELLHIRKGHAAEQTNKESEKHQEEERIRAENVLSGDPLLDYSAQSGSADMKAGRAWINDGVVFKKCAKSEPNKNQNVFVNDAVRNESHRKFMEKYFK